MDVNDETEVRRWRSGEAEKRGIFKAPVVMMTPSR